LKMDISLYPPDEMPAPAKLRRDLKLTGLEVVLTAQPEGYPLRQLTARTNGFTVNTHGRGPPPITVSDIRITSDGLLDLGKVGLRIGPPDAYFLVFEGSIGDALRVKDIDLDATLDLPIIALLKPDDAKDGDALGKITGSFHLSGDSKTLALSDLSAKAQATDLMQMNVTASAGNVLKLSDLSMDISANIPSGAKLLSALKHSSVATGAIDFAAKLSSDGQKWQSETKVSVGKSNLEMALNAQTGQPDPQLDGQITSTLISLTDVRHIISARRELGRTHRDRGKSDGLVSNVTLERLSAEILQSGMDIDIQIDLKKLQGVAGTSSVKTEFIMKNQKAKIGPVKFEYDGGNFDVTGSVDVAKHPDIVTIKGTADGWNFGTILQELNFKKHGSGILNASLDVSGAHKSVEEFARTATGNILVTMRDGRIHTRLLDLAGLGILPWLFSDSHGKVAPIVCLRAPLKFADGKITIDEAALETKKVQMVANGDVDLRNDTVDVTGEPRPIGKPLSRSPWPFVVSGPLKHPKLRLKRGPHRQKRSDGASTMPEHRKLCIPDILQLR
ncbi:MAG: AsmA-like C-terminal region-containing protein, partial [Pseudomonadota bacterium]